MQIFPGFVLAAVLFTAPAEAQSRAAGAGLLTTWGLTMMGAAAMGDAYLGTTVIPVVGPWVTISRVDADGAEYVEGGKPLLVASGLLQGGFFFYLMSSLIADDSPIIVTPTSLAVRLRH